ncbi:MAG: alpha/beta hydrolase [Bacteroidota bacterium]
MRFSLLFLTFLYGCSLFGQEEEIPYKDAMYEVHEPDTYTYAIEGEDTLKMDVFLPKGTTDPARPVVLFVHGGGFAGGTRGGETHHGFCRELASHGYVAITMSYRLTMKGKSFHCDQPAENKVKTFQAAVNDVRGATAALIDMAKNIRIDPSQIVLAGSSAGAEAVLHAAYWAPNLFNEESQLLPNEFSYAGVISFAGALVDVEMITDSNALPTQLFHGTCDNLVPYASAAHHYCEPGDPGYLMLDGAYSIAQYLHELGKPYYLHTTCGGGHEVAGTPMTKYVEEIVDFLYNDVVQQNFRQVHVQINPDGISCEPTRIIPCAK